MATSPDVDTLERETAEARARLAGTLERLTSPQTAQAVKQELTDYAQGLKDNVLGTGRDRAQGYAGDLKARALANPLGLAMIGAGIGWHLYRHPPITTLLVGTGIAMLMKGDSGQRLDASSYRNPYDRAQPRGYVPGGVAGYGYPVEESPPGTTIGDRTSTAVTHAGHVARDLSARVQDAAHAVAERVSETAETLTASTIGAAEAARTAVGHAAETTREAVMGAADTARTAVSDAAQAARSTGSSMLDRSTSAVGTARDTTMRQAGQMVDLAQRNPLLLGALGIAAGTALMYALRSAESGGRSDRDREDRPMRRGERVSSRPRAAQQAGARQGGSRSAQSRPARDTGSSEREGVAGRLSETAEGVAASAADLASGVASTASRALGAAGDAVSSTASGAYGAASSVARSAADVAYSAARRAPRAPAYVQDQISDLGERYPLLLGAVSIALGAAVGGALRLSESENRLMGPISDRLKQRAREVADEQYGVAREAAEHFAGELQTRFAGGNGQDQSADFETVLGGGQPPVGGGQANPSTSPTGGTP
jgi:hypothetical protein